MQLTTWPPVEPEATCFYAVLTAELGSVYALPVYVCCRLTVIIITAKMCISIANTCSNVIQIGIQNLERFFT